MRGLAELRDETRPNPVDLAALRAFMLELYDGRLPTGVVETLICERRHAAGPRADVRVPASCKKAQAMSTARA